MLGPSLGPTLAPHSQPTSIYLKPYLKTSIGPIAVDIRELGSSIGSSADDCASNNWQGIDAACDVLNTVPGLRIRQCGAAGWGAGCDMGPPGRPKHA
jgi:hypothetical protein